MRRTAFSLASAVALLVSGCAPPPAGDAAWFTEDAAARGLRFRHVSGHEPGAYAMPEIMGGGGALFDMDDDGDLDAYLVQSGDLPGRGENRHANELYENAGAGRFELRERSGAEDRGYGMGVAAGDVDSDGDVDLVVTNVGPDVLLLNDGAGGFRDGTSAAGIGHPGWGTSAAFLDADRDGDLDLYVVHYVEWSLASELPCYNKLSSPDYCSPKNYETPTVDSFYRNEGGGRFVDHTAQAGIDAGRGNGLGVGCGDFDGDGWIDVFVANDGNEDFLWKNEGGAAFANIAALAGCAVDEDGLLKAGMGVVVGDLDHDDDLDLMVCNLRRESDSLYLNEGGYFSDRTARAGLGMATRPFTRFGMAWLDFDLDGELDLYQANGRVNKHSSDWSDDPYAEPNLVARGLGGARFEVLEPAGGTSETLIATSRAAAFGDVDGDGRTDVLVVNKDEGPHLLLNRTPEAAWVGFDLRDRHGAPAIGATLRVSVGARTSRRDVRAGYSYLASNDPRILLALGESPAATALEITWPDGERQFLEGPFAGGEVHRIQAE